MFVGVFLRPCSFPVFLRTWVQQQLKPKLELSSSNWQKARPDLFPLCLPLFLIIPFSPLSFLSGCWGSVAAVVLLEAYISVQRTRHAR